MLTDMKIKDFLEELASDSPAPGGGSVAALSGAISAGLISMVCSLSIGKEAYKKDEAILKAVRGRSVKLREELLELCEKDTVAFNKVMDAYKMPKKTDAQAKKRSEAIQDSLKGAADVPFEVAKVCYELMKLTKIIAEKGNQNSITDAGTAALMADAGIQAAAMNVRINMKSIKDPKWLEEMDKKLSEVEFGAVDEMDGTMQLVLPHIESEEVVAEANREEED